MFNKNTKKNQKIVGNLALQNEEFRPAPDKSIVTALLANAVEANGVKFCTLPVSLLDVGPYQRPVLDKVKEIAAHWDPEKAGTIRVNYRDDRLFVTDGQQRMEAAKLAGVDVLMSLVSIGKTLSEEIDDYVTQGDNVTKMSSYDYFYALCHDACDEFAVGLKALFDRYRIVYANPNAGQKYGKKTISRKPAMNTPGRMGALDSVMKIGQIYGLDFVNDIFRMIQLLGWHAKPKAYCDTIVCAARNVLTMAHDKEKTIGEIVRVCNKIDPKDIVVLAQSQNLTAKGPTEALTTYWAGFAR